MPGQSVWTPSPPSPPTSRHARTPSPLPKNEVVRALMTQDVSRKLQLPDPPATLSEVLTMTPQHLHTEEQPRCPPQPTYQGATVAASVHMKISKHGSHLASQALRSWCIAAKGLAAATAAASYLHATRLRRRLSRKGFDAFKCVLDVTCQRRFTASNLESICLEACGCSAKASASGLQKIILVERASSEYVTLLTEHRFQWSKATRRAMRLATVRAKALWIVVEGWHKVTRSAKLHQLAGGQITS